MKQIYYIAAAMTLLVSSCSSDNTITQEANSSIGFSPYVGQATRASVSTIESLRADNFHVFAALHSDDYAGEAPTFMEDKLVSYSQEAVDVPGNWDYKPHKYWPTNTDKVSFFAYTPSNGVITLDNSSALQLTYTVPDECSQQCDVMSAQVLNQTKDSNSGTVHFQFHHILSKIGFAIHPTIDLNNLMTMTIHQLTVTYGHSLTNAGMYNYQNQTWQLIQGEVGIHTQDATTAIVDSDIAVSNAGAPIHPVHADNYLMLLPQVYGTSDIKVTVKFSVTAREADGEGGYRDVITNTETLSAQLPTIDGGWQQGKQYTYTLELGTDMIEFGSPEVDSWADATSSSETTNV